MVLNIRNRTSQYHRHIQQAMDLDEIRDMDSVQNKLDQAAAFSERLAAPPGDVTLDEVIEAAEALKVFLDASKHGGQIMLNVFVATEGDIIPDVGTPQRAIYDVLRTCATLTTASPLTEVRDTLRQAESLVSKYVDSTATGGGKRRKGKKRAKVLIGPQGGKYVIRGGKKVYLKK